MSKKGSQTTTTSNSPDPNAYQAYLDLLNRAQGVAGTPYQSYTGELVAPVNAQQSAGISGINNYANFAQPYIQQAAGMATDAASPITAAQIRQYESPYTQDVVNATQAQFNNQNAQQMQGVKGNAIAQGALGGNREAVAEAETANQQQLAQAPVIANLRNQGYTTGLNTALTEQQQRAAGAYSLGNLGVSGQNAGLTGANAQVGAGTLQQGTQQAQDAANYQQWMNQQSFPYQQAQWLAGLTTGVGSQMGGTGSTTQPGPSGLSQLLGAGTSAAGILGGTGAFGSAGWLTALMARGGAVGRASGGVVPDHDTHTIPEPHETLVAQQRQLVAGHRRAHMFPHGTPELPLPHGMSRVEAHSGVFHYNPDKVHPDQIRMLAEHGRENELLDLGPVSKDEVLHRLNRGELPLAVVERQPDGTEVRAAAGTHLTAHHQVAAMQRTKSPGNRVQVEDIHETMARRLHRADGGRIQHFDTGGGVAGLGDGGPMSGMPYSGAHGWIPQNSISRGPGAPHPSAGVANQQPSAAKMGEQIGAMAKAIAGNGPGQPMSLAAPGQNGFAPSPVGATMPMGLAPQAFSPTDISGSAGAVYRRGGAVGRFASGGIANLPAHDRIMVPHGYADGGSPYDDGIPFDPTAGGIAPDQTQFNVDPEVNAVTKDILRAGAPLPKSNGFHDAAGVAPPPKADVEPPRDGASFSDRFNGDAAPPASGIANLTHDAPLDMPHSTGFQDQGPAGDSGIGDLSPAPLHMPQSAGFAGPAPVVTGTDAVPPAAARNLSSPTAGFADNMDKIAAAHRSIESSGNYHALGPINPKTGDRAYGAYQVMGANVPVWTKEILGHSLTPSQFLASKEAQDAVYKAKMGSYINQLGLPGAVHAWLGPGKKDFTGTTQEDYLHRFQTALGMGPSDGVAGGHRLADDNSRLPQNSTPTIGNNSTELSAQSRQGVAPPSGIDWSANGKLWPALISAGFGMMASRSPFPGVAIGEGGQQGLQTYSTLRQQEAQRGMKQQEIDMEARKLAQAADIAQRPYSQMTVHQKAEVEALANYRQGMLDRENSTYLGPSADGTGSLFLDKKTGTVTSKPVQVGAKPVGGATLSLARGLMEDRERQRAADPSLPELTLEEATTLAHRAPNADQDTIRRLNLASSAWKSWTSNPINMGKKNAPESTLDYWEQRYGVKAGAPPSSGRAPVAPPPAAPAAPAPSAAAAPPPRPPSVPADAKPQRNKTTGAVRWLAADGSVYSADGTRQ